MIPDCSHFELIYLPQYVERLDKTVSAYKCTKCEERLVSIYLGGTLDVSQYTVNVVGYSGLKLELTKPKSQLELKLE